MLNVRSDVGRLRKVLVHEPGAEVDVMVPDMMEDLLFDDILYGDLARTEHRRFQRVMQHLGVEVIDAYDLLIESLNADEEARKWLFRALASELDPRRLDLLESLATTELVDALSEGLRCGPDAAKVGIDGAFVVPPLPNWCFQRDPQVVIGSSVLYSSMATPARWREAVLARTIFEFHPELMPRQEIVAPPAHMPMGPQRPLIEGGDVLVLSSEIVVIGRSERTNRAAVYDLVAALKCLPDPPKWLIAVALPSKRAYMHLDTVFTPVDQECCLVHVPVILETGSDAAECYAFDLSKDDPRPIFEGPFLGALAKRGLDYAPIPCGGDDTVAQQREQWTDGANCLALSPGKILLYERNVETAIRLDREGFQILLAKDLLLGEAELDLDEPGRKCVLLQANELSRARGGPHCLSHALVRDPVG